MEWILRTRMKLKYRIACVLALSVCTLIGVHLYVLSDFQDLLSIERVGKHVGNSRYQDFRLAEHAHLPAGRKRLNKSNFSGDADADSNNLKNFKNMVDDDVGLKQQQQPLQFPDALPTDTDRELFYSTVKDFKNLKVDQMISTLKSKNPTKFDLQHFEKVDYLTFLKDFSSHFRKSKKSLAAFKKYDGTANWEKFHQGIRKYHLYNPDDGTISGLLKDLNRVPFVDVDMKDGGTQLKLIITFEDEGMALLKPMRYPRTQETLPNHFYFTDYERHNAEIAAFHLDRALGFYRVPPTTGRLLNISSELKTFADRKLAKTFFYSPAGNLCFHGSCSYYCDTSHAICGHPDTLEVSLATFLPPEEVADRKTWRNPWKRSYSKHRKAYWEVYDDLCEKVKNRPPYNKGRRLLDLMDLTIFDFIIGNMDRHHYETFLEFGNDTFMIHMDHGRAFGQPHKEEMTIMAPVLQCCLIRYSTYMKLTKFYIGPQKLSEVWRHFADEETIAPILVDTHLVAMDRRVAVILQIIEKCLQDNHVDKVIIDDGI